ncbi:MGMT family protein [Agaribacter flavus]|uniref:MGMT family protein n=1 Tax=Agaribacter flavus TaxID=1902781 RepID=A0ABV7FKP1_9ALTE
MKIDYLSEPNEKQALIYHVINLIPFGCVASYGQIAELAGLPGRARLVGKYLGQACASRAISWHRVVRSSGQLAFEKGSEQAKIQTSKLQEENIAVLNHRVSMSEFQWKPSFYE